MTAEQVIFLYKKEETAEMVKLISSDGVTEKELEELQNKFRYVPGDSGSSYTYFRLESGRYSLVKIFGGSEDLLGHCLIFSEMKNYPFEFMDSPDFSTSILPEKVNALSSLRRGPHVQNPEIIDFISSRGEESLEEILNLLIFSSMRGKSLHIVDNSKAHMSWIIGILSAFPLKIASGISFTTCNFMKDFCMLHFGKESNMADNLIVYDFLSSFKAGIQFKYRYSQLIRTGYFKSKNLLLSLHRFLEQFKYSELNDDIDRGCLAFLMLNYSGVKFTGNDINWGMEFLLKYGEEETLQAMFERHTSIFQELQKQVDKEGCKLMLEYSLEIFKGVKGRLLFEKAVNLFYGSLDYMALSLQVEKEVFYRYYSDGEVKSGDRSFFYKSQTSTSRIAYLNEIMKEIDNPNIHEAYLYTLLNSLIKTGTTWNQAAHIEGFEVFIDTSVKRIINSTESLEHILSSFKENQEYFINIAMIIFNRIESSSTTALLGEIFSEYLRGLDEGDGVRVRRAIFQRGGGTLLLQEFRKSLSRSENKREYFTNYKNNIFSSIQDYSKQYYQEAAVTYLTELKPEEALGASLEFLQEAIQNSSKFDRDSLQGILQIFERNLPFKDIETLRQSIREAAKLKRARDIKTYPDITYLVDILFYIEENNGLSVRELIEEISFNLRGIKEENLIIYINLFFVRILPHVRSKEDHKDIIDFVFKESWEDNIVYYFDRISNLYLGNREKGYRPFIHYISYYFYFIEPFHRGKEDGIVDYVENKLVEIFEMESRGFLEGVDKDIRFEFEEKGFSIPIKWNDMYIKALERKTLKGKIKKLFSKG